MNRATLVLVIALVGVQLIDAVVHLATGQVEVIRLIASAVIVIAAVVANAVPVGRRSVMAIGAAIYLALNVVFLVDAGAVNSVTGAPRIAMIVFVVLSLATAIVLALRMRRAVT